jgi:hypothetical protein
MVCYRDSFTFFYASLRGVPCHHGMVHPQIMDEGDSLQLSKLAVNKLNKQADSWQGVGLPVGGWAWGEQPLTVKNKPVTRIHRFFGT